MKNIKRVIEKNKNCWDSHLKLALWDDRVIVKKSIGHQPFGLVYGLDA